VHDSTEKSRVFVARAFAAFAGALAGTFALVFSTIELVTRAGEFDAASSLAFALLAVSTTAMVSYGLTRIVALAYVVSLLRGPGSVKWCPPWHCRALSWLAFDWRFNSEGGMQIGERCLGLEVALQGRLA
jgi:hypothetical protein